MKILKATPKDADKITQLRIDAYHHATNATITDFSFLHWNKTDDENLVFFIEDEDGEPMASIRMILLHSKAEVEQKLDIRIHEELEMPVLLVDRLTTAVAHRRKGMSAILRYFYIHACTRSKVKNIALTVNEGTSRIPFLKELGFEFEVADISHREDILFDNSSQVLFVKLQHANFASAANKQLEHLRTDLSELTGKTALISDLQNFTGVLATAD